MIVLCFLLPPLFFPLTELDLLYRHHAYSNLLSCLTTLESIYSGMALLEPVLNNIQKWLVNTWASLLLLRG